jgi:hypothetical protein
MTDLGTLFVVVPDAAHAPMEPKVASLASKFTVQVVKEQTWVPEMESFHHLPGWYKQQLVKLAAAEVVTTDFFLTLDADVVCTRPVSYDALLPGGRARCFIIAHDEHPDWYRGAEAVLDLRAKRRNVLHNVTPCVWAKAGVLELIEHLNQVARRRPYASAIRGLQQRLFLTTHRLGRHRNQPPWRGWLAASRPWAEYATYFTFLEATGRFDTYHFESDQCIYDIERSLWYKESRIEDLDVESLFRGEGPPYFVVIQSNAGNDAARTWQKLGEYLGQAEPQGHA